MKGPTSPCRSRTSQCPNQVSLYLHSDVYVLIISGPDEVLLRLNITGLCYTDIHFMKADLGVGTMSSKGVRSPGHEGAGVVVKVGANVKNIAVGDRGGIKPMWDTCGACEMCWGDKETYCADSISTGMRVAGSFLLFSEGYG